MKRNHQTIHRFSISLFLIILLKPISSVFTQEPADPPAVEMRDVGTVLESGYILQDRNGDSVTDYIHTRIIVPKNPSEIHLVCAANIAARLGYETSGMDLDLVQCRSSLPNASPMPLISIEVPPKTSSKQGRKYYPLLLAPGQGRIRYDGPESYPEQGVVSLYGADDTGLIAAVNYFAGRYPDLWKLKGKTLPDVRRKFEKFFKQRGLSWDAICIHTIDIGANRPGILKLSLTVRLQNQDCFERAVKVLKGEEEEKNEDNLQIADLEFCDVHKIFVELLYSKSQKTIVLIPKKAWNTQFAMGKATSPSRQFSLCRLYTIDGLLQDTNKDFIPDDIPAYISTGGVKNVHTIDNIAARIGLESAGLRMPLVRVAGEEEKPERYGFPILFGTDHYTINRMIEENKLRGMSETSRAGFIQFVFKVFKENNCIVMSGNNPAGLTAISDYVAKRLPYLWDYGKGNFRLEDIEEDVREFFQIRKAPGQVALALDKLESWLHRIDDRHIDSIAVEIAAEKTPSGLDGVLRDLVKKVFDSAAIDIKLHPTGFGVDQPVISEEFDIPWEVDDFWNAFRREALPQITSDSRGEIRVLVSESPEIRKQLKDRIEEELRKKNGPENAVEVVVLCAYKQGFSWLHDEILPKIVKKPVGRIEITYHSLKDSKEVRWQTIHANTRWLQEIYPIDCVLARELNISDTLITFHPTLEKDPIYTVDVYDKQGKKLLQDFFSPKYVIQPFFQHFPEYDSVRVTTGWMSVNINGKTILDRRIKTDPEKFWEHLQRRTFRKIIDYVMDIQDGRPSPENVPYFDEFNVKLTLSEPNYRIGIDEEVISSLEALHEDILFETLTLFNLLSGRYGSGSIRFPGQIVPDIQPSVDGRSGSAKITFTGKRKARPQLVMTYREQNKEPVRKRYDLNPLNIPDPKLTGIWVEPGKTGITQLMFDITATDSVDRYEEFKLRSSENAIDQAFVPATRFIHMIHILGHLHGKGLFEDALSYDRVENILFRVVLEDSLEVAKFATVSCSRNPMNTQNPVLLNKKYKYTGERLIHWDFPMNPGEVADHLAKLNVFQNIHVYYTTTSFLGHDIYTVDLFPSMEAGFVSQAKLNALKPTLFLVGRVHGNEVSSTSHILRLAELCATDTNYTNLLKNVNLVLYPVANPDGAQIAYDMQKINPDFMLHAGRYGALGTDVRSRDGDSNNRYPEAGMVQRIREMWLPDVYIDLHGVPSHEWVQYFAGYSAWVRSRNVGPRSYWLPRGWYITGFSWLEDKKHPELMEAQRAIIDTIVAAVRSQPEVEAMNQRLYKRYIKYGRQDEENYREYFHNGIQVEARLKPRKVTGKDVTNPKITYFSATTEAADETARGDWMALVCKAGLAHTSAVLGYLSEGVNRIEREAKEDKHGISRFIFRKRPILPPEKKKQTETEKGNEEH